MAHYDVLFLKQPMKTRLGDAISIHDSMGLGYLGPSVDATEKRRVAPRRRLDVARRVRRVETSGRRVEISERRVEIGVGVAVAVDASIAIAAVVCGETRFLYKFSEVGRRIKAGPSWTPRTR